MVNEPQQSFQGDRPPEVLATLAARSERQLIRTGGSFRHVVFHVHVAAGDPSPIERSPLRLALVLDRSGSMAGGKLDTAKRAALAVLDRLTARDTLAVVIFDSRIDVLQPAVAVTLAAKARVRAALAPVQPRGSTALHEGWLTGCHAIAADSADAGWGLARCFLLTDGLANVGETDPETIATQAADIRERTGIGTSTFGIGADYDERLLGPMAVAGGGQFHHLRSPEEIAHTFVGELGELLAVAAHHVSLELEAAPETRVEVISDYWVKREPNGMERYRITIGDLLGGEERYIVVRFGFPPGVVPEQRRVRARLRWWSAGVEHYIPWQELTFTYASHAECDAEVRDAQAMHWVGLHHAARARREAAERSRRGDLHGAREILQAVGRRIAEYAGPDLELQAALQDLRQMEQLVADRPVDPLLSKELQYQSLRMSRMQRDYRPQ
jgi:Ca-activated chloride channel family protein